ncbi:hypothetical protein TCAL_04157 [Tigriopus californicus]|uniref:Endoplasmic reticulum junction formation protein lunapark n=1 Tax=Tigriopus californicus TaxID=6832 RepID=A0A553NU17_TIGCA|nr:endoplasmic reticulum junction formation protein lunapark-A-like [Tigriopus californicus]TRY68903.1 hypothetical protein TCAL_04157 [Tigriopus californicus]|eukprot:TCALIF_04157-PA protein Name:"Similar to lnpb Protein lunapark-B (Danio rerio)" AED:0.04 eAED:0.04 QI:279/1/1/1/1/1/8/215/438
MGILLSRFWKKKSTPEVLEAIQGQIGSIQSFKRNTQASQRKVIGYLVAYFSVLYVLGVGVAYFKYYHHPDWQDWHSQLRLWIPILIAPILLFLVRKVLTWWYHRKIRRNEIQLEKLMVQKRTLLEKVMETETYKVAKEILEKYAPEQLTASKPGFSASKVSTSKMPSLGSGTPLKGTPTPRGPNPVARANTLEPASLDSSSMELRRRGTNPQVGPVNSPASAAKPQANNSVPNSRADQGNMSVNGSFTAADRNRKPFTPVTLTQRSNQHVPPGPPLPRPVLPRERGYMDRMVEYLVGDGPANRFALICKQCASHNGMALKEEFEYTAYRCCYCYHWNPARKQRPTAPKLSASNPMLSKRASTESSSSEDETSPSTLAKTTSLPKLLAAGSQKSDLGDASTINSSQVGTENANIQSVAKESSEESVSSLSDQKVEQDKS